MKNIFYYLVCCLIVVSCDKREDYYKNTNQSVVTSLSLTNAYSNQTSSLSSDGLTIHDTLKLGFDYNFSISISDEFNAVDCYFSGDGNLFVDNSGYSGVINLSTGNHIFKWNSSTIGNKTFQLTFTDIYGVETTYNFYVSVFDNWTPYITWNVVHVGDLSPLHKRFLITGHDGDFMYGGNILYYQIIINNDTTNYPNSQMDYVFPAAGYYNIGVRAMDSNYEWSNFPIVNNFYISN